MTTFLDLDLPDLSGQTAIVTGASSGIGQSVAHALAGTGARVVLAVRNPAKGQAVAATIARPDRGPPARPGPAGIGAGVRGRLGRPDRAAGQQRGRVGPDPDPYRRRLRVGFRRQPPGSLRPDQPVAGAGHRPGRDRGFPGRADGPARLRRPQLDRSALPAVPGLQRLQAGQPALHRRTPAPPDRRGLPGQGHGRAPGSGRRPRSTSTTARAAWPISPGRRCSAWSPRTPITAPCRSCSPRSADIPGDSFAGPRHLAHMRGGAELISRSAVAQDPALARRLWTVSEQLTGVRSALAPAVQPS